ncbi:MAG: DUF2784 family protein [Armatimonadetes bacterium]|nr:DUF2784 family protein [Armatimonadota bacterium]MBS1727787.1 DUF2784 family protein [Armatimonadota bacterium]
MNTLGLQFLNVFLIVFHTAILLFNVFGWIWKKTRRWNLYLLLGTFFSWLILGLWKGIGYCVVTDLHWQVRRALGERILDGSFLDYLMRGIAGDVPDPNLTRLVCGVTFAFVGMMSIGLNVRDAVRSHKLLAKSC